MKHLTKKQKTIQVQRQIKKLMRETESKMMELAESEVKNLPEDMEYFLENDTKIFNYVRRFFSVC